MFSKLIALGIAGFAGTIARYALAGAVYRFTGAEFPWGTLLVNAIGCLLTGSFWALAEYHLEISGGMRTIVLIGFFGAFTTFSSLMLETAELARSSEILAAVKNLVLQNVIGALCLAGGILLVRSLKGG